MKTIATLIILGIGAILYGQNDNTFIGSDIGGGEGITAQDVVNILDTTSAPLFITNQDQIDSTKTTNWSGGTYGYYTGNMSYFPVDSGVFYSDSISIIMNDGVTMVKALLSGGGASSPVDTFTVNERLEIGDTLGWGDSYIRESSADRLRVTLGGTDRFTFQLDQLASVTTFGASIRSTSTVASPTHTYQGDENTGTYRIRGDAQGITAGGFLGLGVYEDVEDSVVLFFNTKIKANLEVDSVFTVKSGAWSDYVFEKKYKLTPFERKMRQVKKLSHLPSMPRTEYINPVEYINSLEKELEELYLYVEQINDMVHYNYRHIRKVRPIVKKSFRKWGR